MAAKGLSARNTNLAKPTSIQQNNYKTKTPEENLFNKDATIRGKSCNALVNLRTNFAFQFIRRLLWRHWCQCAGPE